MTTLPDLFAPMPGPPAEPAYLPSEPRAGGQTRGRRAGLNWPFWWALAYIGFQVSLLFVGSTGLRTPARVAAYSLSLVMLVLLRPGRTGRHPALKVLPLVLLSLVPGLFMGESSMLAGLGQATLYVAILSPLVWVSHRPMSGPDLRSTLLLLWGFNTLSAAVGVLQTYYPGLFDNQIAAVLQERGDAYLGALTIVLADGRRAFRPMGLTDSPGGAAIGGLYAILFGIGLLFTERRWVMKGLAVGGMVVGLVVIYLAHVRVTLVMAVLSVIVIGVTFVRRGDLRRTTGLLAVLAVVAVLGTAWAFAVGGDETYKRFVTLLQDDPTNVYQSNRGHFVEQAFGVQLWDHPFGQGIGRWGMVANYFGNPKDYLWAEIMWESWLDDGGVPLMVLYVTIVVIAGYVAWRIGTARGGGGRGGNSPVVTTLAIWAAVVLAYDVSAMAATFDSPIFGTQTGMELWFLNACLYNAWANRDRFRADASAANRRPPAARPGRRPPPWVAVATGN